MSQDSRHLYEFGPFRLDPAERLLLRNGVSVSLPPKAFATLSLLVERSGRVWGKEDLLRAVWPETFVEENNLTQCISILRKALGGNGNGQGFIETVPRLGYRFTGEVRKIGAGLEPEPVSTAQLSPASPVIRDKKKEEILEGAASEKEPAVPLTDVPIRTETRTVPRQTGFLPLRKRHVFYAAVGMMGLGIVLLAYWFMRPLSPPHILNYEPISSNVEPVSPLYSDGVHFYLSVSSSNGPHLAMMPATGGPALLFEIPSTLNLQPEELAPGGTEMLAQRITAGTSDDEDEIWIIPLPTGSPWPVGLRAHSAGWSPHGDEIVYAHDNRLYTARRDGGSARELVSLPGPAWSPHWSPDGKWIRFEIRGASHSLWEVAADGTRLRRLLEDQGLIGDGYWTADGKFFVFSRKRDGRSDLWALQETSPFGSAVNASPVRLTNGQLDFSYPVPSRDGKRIFALGRLQQAEIVRRDSATNSFEPFLAGVSADSLAFSRDGKWVVYSTYPERALWRSRIDGSERLQLTFAPTESLLPQWSPDGETIAFTARLPGKPWKVYLISAQGGLPQPLIETQLDVKDQQATPAWSADGTMLAFAGAPWETNFTANSTAIHCLDMRTHQLNTLPDSEGLWSPRWSPDGRSLVAEAVDSKQLKLFDFRTRRWRSLAIIRDGIVEYTAWSKDSRFLYFNVSRGKTDGIYRVPVAGKASPELVLKVTNVPNAETLGRWFTLDPEGSPLLLRDISIRKIFSLNLQSP